MTALRPCPPSAARAPKPSPAGAPGRASGPVTGAGPASANAPSIGLPLRFVLTGLAALLTGVVGLAARPDILATYHYNQYVVALTHLFTLGFITTIIMGATYQLVPVALETRLYSERLARWQFVLHLAGFVGMVWMFWIWDLKQVGHFGSALALGVALFVYDVARTLRSVPRWNVVAGGITSALVWLSLTVLMGLTVAAAKCSYDSPPAQLGATWAAPLIAGLRAVARTANRFDAIALMHAHAHLGAIGFFLMMIVSVSYKLVPMFALSDLQSPRRAWTSVWLLNGGLAGLFLTLALKSAWKLAFALVVIAGLAVYGWELRAMLRARKRRVLDWGLRYFVTAACLLVGLAALAVVLCWPGLPATLLTTQLENVYGFLGLIGVVTFTIMGFLYKIVPFLAWYHSYSPRIGRYKVPSLGDLYSARLQAVGYWLFVAALLVVAVATAAGHARAVQGGLALLIASLFVFALNMGLVLSHFGRPRCEPLGAPLGRPRAA